MNKKTFMKKKLTSFLSSTDSSLSAKNILGLSLLGGIVGFAFSDKDGSTGGSVIDHIFPSVEGHSSSISNGAQGTHSSHSNHSNSGSGSGDSGSGDGGGDGGA